MRGIGASSCTNSITLFFQINRLPVECRIGGISIKLACTTYQILTISTLTYLGYTFNSFIPSCKLRFWGRHVSRAVIGFRAFRTVVALKLCNRLQMFLESQILSSSGNISKLIISHWSLSACSRIGLPN